MDKVFIEALRIDTVIGVLDWERRIRQTVVLDIEMDFAIAQAATTDAIADALDYGTVAARITTYVQAATYELIESLAEHCAEIILTEFPVSAVVIRLNKPGAVANAATVGVRIERRATTLATPAILRSLPD